MALQVSKFDFIYYKISNTNCLNEMAYWLDTSYVLHTPFTFYSLTLQKELSFLIFNFFKKIK